ncbi:MAG: adenylosuccinate synthase [Propionibacteriaceae bacterium]|jgi:adenylosuccinate synthase|nr:adenylosuccinate synthase [Propionibacteriaceae bacterium]
MPGIVIVGTQWGDEGKGKATDQLGDAADYVVRYSGGNNAGHTVVVGREHYALHLLPSGVLSQRAVPVLGNGVVIDLDVLFQEIDALAARGLAVGDKLLVSANAHLITVYHQRLDKVTERFLGRRRLGTTGRGVGPAYADKASRVGLRVQDLLDPSILRQKVEAALEQKNQLLVKVYNRPAVSADEVCDRLLAHAERVRPMTADVSRVLNRALDEGRTVLFEGAQAHHLDVDFGTYPYVTSSNPIAAGACTGTGVGPTRLDRVVGIAKAYTTRVGEGPFPGELTDDVGQRLRQGGGEFGTTTGRPRRCGWFDALVVEQAGRVNALTDLFLTKLDVLTGWDPIPVVVAYDVDGERHETMPMTQTELHHARPVYQYLDGWGEDISAARRFQDLPRNCQAYVRRLEELVGVRVSGIGVGPERDQTIMLHPLMG